MVTSTIETPVEVKLNNFPPPRRAEALRPILSNINVNSTRNFLTKLTSFTSRRSNSPVGQQASLMVKSEIDNIVNRLPTERKNRIRVEMIPITGYVANSIMVLFEGSGADKDQHVLFGAHQDDVGHPIAGADDDGSGSTCVFESFRVIAESSFNPSKSLVFFFYTAEESGLVGSRQIARDWRARNMKVVGHLNMDMVGNHPVGTPLAGRRLTLNTTPTITEYMFTLSRLYTRLDIDQWRFNGGSDHIPWFQNQYESACLSERVFSPHYHTPRDLIQNVNFELIVEFSKLAASYLVECS